MSHGVATKLLFLLVLAISACGDGSTYKPDASGAQGEVLVVMDHGHWEGPPGQAVRATLERVIGGLPQREARFKVAQTGRDRFGNLLRNHHNIVYADIGADSSGVYVQQDRYARGQLVIHVAAAGPEAFIALMHEQGETIADRADEHQRSRVMARIAGERDATIGASVEAAMGLRIDVPKGYRVMHQDEQFAWLQRDRMMSGAGLEHNVIEGILLYTYPYTSDSTFSVEYLVDRRDDFTRDRLPGPNPGSYMIVQRSFEHLDLMPESRHTTLDGRYAMQLRGLYGMHGAKMGGPFVSLTTVDEARGRVVTAEGFVYAPQFDKREYVRELEAVTRSLRIPSDTSP